MNERKKLVEVQGLSKRFPVKTGLFQKRKYVHAVDKVSLYIFQGETLGLVGESGCGKTTFGRTVIRLYEPSEGKIIYDGNTICDVGGNVSLPMKDYYRRMQLIFQDPSASLDPRMTVGEIIGEALDIHGITRSAAERSDRIKLLLSTVGMNTEHANRFPHEFSGGQQQRIGIARALAVEPEFIVCDEPISALDVSIQSQVVNMLEDLQEKLGLTYLFIAHDLSVVRHISQRIGVMYLGNLVELGESYEVCGHALHPYTQCLISAAPLPDPKLNRTRERIELEGEIPSPMDPPTGCRFHTRCRFATEECARIRPDLKECAPGHYVACHKL